MNDSPAITLSHFSDILCIWAYIAQVRLDQLKQDFGSRVVLRYHYLPVFGAVNQKMTDNWSTRGGVEGYHQHVLAIADDYDHVTVHPEVWKKDQPVSSTGIHLFLKALALVQDESLTTENPPGSGPSVLEQFTWATRLAFFRDGVNVSQYQNLVRLASEMGLPIEAIEAKIHSGEAYAALEKDQQISKSWQVTGSPTLVFNEGRQIIYGNVGYRVIEANVRELLHQPGNQASWC